MNPKKFPLAGTLLLASITAFPIAALAAEAGAGAGGSIEEIVVTATKRASTLQNVPFSIAAVTDEKIRESGTTNLVDLARNVVGVSIADLGPGQSQVAIRGISAGQVIRDQPGVKEQVGIYLDESPISVALFTPDLDLYDLDRFEVLRGPQGTLFGAGSTSGTMRYITNQPDLDELCRLGGGDVLHGLEGRDRRQHQGHGQRAARAVQPRCASSATTIACRASSTLAGLMAASTRT